MKRYKPSEKLPKHFQQVVIYTGTGWTEALWNREIAMFQDEGANQFATPNEVEWWADPMEEE